MKKNTKQRTPGWYKTMAQRCKTVLVIALVVSFCALLPSLMPGQIADKATSQFIWSVLLWTGPIMAVSGIMARYYTKKADARS